MTTRLQLHSNPYIYEYKYIYISLWDVRFHANTERFQGLVPLWSHLCPLSVRLGGVCGAYSESP